MNPSNGLRNEKTEAKGVFKNLKSDYFIRKIFDNIQTRISLEIIKYNIRIQKRINININNYKEYLENFSPIEIEIKPVKNKYGKFINMNENKIYYHIYFNDNKEEIKIN